MKIKIIQLLFLLVIACLYCKKENHVITDTTGKYFLKVKAIIETNCTITCHSPSKGYNQGLPVILDTDSDIVKRAIAVKGSLVGPFNLTTNRKMPLGGQLSNSDIDIVVKWVDSGGKATN